MKSDPRSTSNLNPLVNIIKLYITIITNLTVHVTSCLRQALYLTGGLEIFPAFVRVFPLPVRNERGGGASVHAYQGKSIENVYVVSIVA